MTDAERAQRERLREGAGGITSYATDANTTVVAFAVGGTLFAGGLISGRVRRLDVRRPGVRPPPRPDGAADRLRVRPATAHRRARRPFAAARSTATDADQMTRNGVVGSRRLHRRRGDGPVPRLLVESRRHRDRGVPRRRRAGRRVGDRRPGDPERTPPERSATRRPGPTTPSSRCTCSGSTARASTSTGTASTSRTSRQSTGPTPAS